jgi:tight adherence protein C
MDDQKGDDAVSTVLGLTALALAAAAASFIMIIRELHLRALNARVSNAVLGVPDRTERSQDLIGWLSSIGSRYSRFYQSHDLEQLKTIVQAAGFNHHRTLPVWIGAKIISLIFFPLATFLFAQLTGKSPATMVIFLLFGVVIGIMGPRMVLLVMKRRFDKAVRLGTPDAIDLLVVCSEAGMGLESALERVADEMSRTNPATAQVLQGLLNDLRIMPNRIDAFEKLGVTSEGLRRFGTMVSQSLQYGTPLSQALRTIAADLRRERITKLEERAHKLGAKLTVPMVLFLMPAMFIVLGASPFLNLVATFAKLRP